MELTAEMKECVTCTDVREKSVSQSLPVAGSFNQSGDVHHVQVCRLFAVVLPNYSLGTVFHSLVSLFLPNTRLLRNRKVPITHTPTFRL